MAGYKRGPVTTRRQFSKRLKKDSSEDLSIEEIAPDDMAYDADVEVLFPDQCEEAESESEGTLAGSGAGRGIGTNPSTPRRKMRDVDEELVARMRRLGHERSVSDSPRWSESDRGRKRLSKEMEEDIDDKVKGKHSELEVVEIIEGTEEPPPLKRRRRRSRVPTGSMDVLQESRQPPAHTVPWREHATKDLDQTSSSSFADEGQDGIEDSAMDIS